MSSETLQQFKRVNAKFVEILASRGIPAPSEA